MHEDAIEKLSKMRNLTLSESRVAIAKMSFMQYLRLLEAGANITPPSGQAIGPSRNPVATSPGAPTGAPATIGTPSPSTPGVQSAPTKAPVLWKGQGSPVEQGMTVGLKGPNGLPVAGEITQVDQSANGVKVKNPTTGQEEWHGNDDLQPYEDQSATSRVPGTQQQQMSEELARMRQLAGIAEDCSSGATGAGSIAVAPAAMGTVKRRQPVEEGPSEEYTPKEPAKTIIGDTKPSQASGRLSANLAARGQKTASRTNNGFKK